MELPVAPPYPPMEAETADTVPEGEGWQYEPKWDGFRCLAFRDGEEVRLQSKSGKPLGRYFPDVVEAVRRVSAPRFVLDGELVIEAAGALSFEQLQLRLHPAASRVRKLAAAHPAVMVVFDLLVDEAGRDLAAEPLAERRRRLEGFAARNLGAGGRIVLSPASGDAAAARAWLASGGGTLDGILAKRLDQPYRSGERAGMVKVKRLRSADCVVAGFRHARGGDAVGSLLLGLYGDDGLLHHVGFTASFSGARRRTLLERLEPLAGSAARGAGFTGRAPGGPSRWSAEERAWTPVLPELVAEVEYDHVTGGRFRHGTRFLRWRPDKAPSQCTSDQLPAGGVPAATLAGVLPS